MPGLVLQARRRGDAEPVPADEIRFGLTASRKVGGAVDRNRARRRLRALAREILPLAGRPGTDYVLIARTETATRAHAALRADLERALARVARPSAGPKRAAGGGARATGEGVDDRPRRPGGDR